MSEKNPNTSCGCDHNSMCIPCSARLGLSYGLLSCLLSPFLWLLFGFTYSYGGGGLGFVYFLKLTPLFMLGGFVCTFVLIFFSESIGYP